MTKWVEESDGSWTLKLETIGELRVTPEIGHFWMMHARFPPFRHGATWIVGRIGDSVEDVLRNAARAAVDVLDQAKSELDQLRK